MLPTVEKVKITIAKALSAPLDKVVPEALIVDDLGADSLDLAELAMALQEEFEVDMTDAQLAEIKTVQDVIAVIVAADSSKSN